MGLEYSYSEAFYGNGSRSRVAAGRYGAAKKSGIAVASPSRGLFLYDRGEGGLYGQSLGPAINGNPNSTSSSDLNRDGGDEIVLGTDRSLGVVRWDRGIFRPVMEARLRGITGLGTGNFDGRFDEILLSLMSGEIVAMDLRGRRRPIEVEGILEGQPRVLAVGDATNDGRSDIVLAIGGRRVAVLQRRGRVFIVIWISDPLPSTPSAAGIGDFDGDGRNELIVASGGDIFVFRWNGTRFVLVDRLRLRSPVISIFIFDIDFDGRAEIIVAVVTGEIFVLRPRVERITQFSVSETVEIESIEPVREIVQGRVRDTVVQNVTTLPATNIVLVEGFFVVDILFTTDPSQVVRVFTTRIPFAHIIRIPGLRPGVRVRVQVTVEFSSFRGRPENPQLVDVFIVARATVLSPFF